MAASRDWIGSVAGGLVGLFLAYTGFEIWLAGELPRGQSADARGYALLFFLPVVGIPLVLCGGGAGAVAGGRHGWRSGATWGLLAGLLSGVVVALVYWSQTGFSRDKVGASAGLTGVATLAGLLGGLVGTGINRFRMRPEGRHP
jgi:hypothetical protein